MKAIRELVRTLLGMPANSVRPANQNAPTGGKSESFATVLVTGTDRNGWDEVAHAAAPDDEIEETITGHRTVTASVQFFRGDALTRAGRLQTLLNSSAALELMESLGLGLVSMSEVKDLTQVIDTYNEERAQIALSFNVVAVEKILIKTYGTFPITLSTPEDSTTFEVTEP